MNTDIFKKSDIRRLLQGKHVAFFGDSNVRAVYKDFVVLLQKDALISDQELKTKMEASFLGDSLTHSGVKYNGRDYRENRFFTCRETNTTLAFFYLTRIYNDYLLSIFDVDVARNRPDIVFVNSCLWDITRWGPNGVQDYQKNLKLFAKLLKERLHEDCLIVWITAPPISQDVRGGFLVPQLQFLQYSLRFHVAEANFYAAKVFGKAGYDVVDIHYYLTKFLRWRVKDGIHWFPPVVRYVTNRLLTHVSLAWGVELPHRIEKVLSCIPPFDDTVFSRQLSEQQNIQESTEPESMILATPEENFFSPDTSSPTIEEASLSPSMDTPTKDEKTTPPPQRVPVFERIGKEVENSSSRDVRNGARESATDQWDTKHKENRFCSSENFGDENSNFNFDSKGRSLFVLSENTQNKNAKKKNNKRKRDNQRNRKRAEERREERFQAETQRSSQTQQLSYVPNFVNERHEYHVQNSSYSMHDSMYVSNPANPGYVYPQMAMSQPLMANPQFQFHYDVNMQQGFNNFLQPQNSFNLFDHGHPWFIMSEALRMSQKQNPLFKITF